VVPASAASAAPASAAPPTPTGYVSLRSAPLGAIPSPSGLVAASSRAVAAATTVVPPPPVLPRAVGAPSESSLLPAGSIMNAPALCSMLRR
jgi:hypothetical protein